MNISCSFLNFCHIIKISSYLVGIGGQFCCSVEYLVDKCDIFYYRANLSPIFKLGYIFYFLAVLMGLIGYTNFQGYKTFRGLVTFCVLQNAIDRNYKVR